MQDGDPQIHFEGNDPGAGTCVVKSIRSAAATERVCNADKTVVASGTATKVLRSILTKFAFRELKGAWSVNVRHALGKNRRFLIGTYTV